MIDETGKMLGLFSFSKALAFAVSKSLDLVLMNNTGDVPVVRIADYNKLLYEQKKKLKEAKKNQVIQKQKEVVFKLNIAENDFNIKIKHIKEFLADQDKVKITIKMERRIAASNKELGIAFAERIMDALADEAYIKDMPKQVNNLIFINAEPIKK